MSPMVEFVGISCRGRGGHLVFEDVNLVMSPGERVLLVAPPGSGKALFIELLAGLSIPEEGAVVVLGEDTSALGAQALSRLRQRMGFVFRESVLVSNLKVIENVALPIEYHTRTPGAEAKARAMELLSKVGYMGDPWSLPGPLPMYAKKKAAIARAMSLEPEIIVCEGISDGLTDEERAHLVGILLDYQGATAGRLLVFTGIDDSDSRRLSPVRLLTIENRRIVEAA